MKQSLADLDQLVDCLDDESFLKSDHIIQGCIGEHIRHILDHIAIVFHAILEETEEATQPKNEKPKLLFYDQRQRGRNIETDRQLCCQELREWMKQISKVSECLSQAPQLKSQTVEVVHIIDKGNSTDSFPSQIERELMFVYHHLLHHNAIIAIRLRLLGKETPAYFGVAPSTIVQ